jgi:hypothetical protein
MSQNAKMTRKEALAILYKVKDAARTSLYSPDANEETRLLGTQVYDALKVLTTAVHGKAKTTETGHLCEVCYLRYVPLKTPFVFLRDDPIANKDLCGECLERLKAEGKIERLENWMTREVTQC